MNPIEVLLSEPFAQTLGWTLLHFVWQGGLVALLLAVALRVLRRHAAPVRYAVACGALLLLLALPILTMGLLWPTSPEEIGFATMPEMATAPGMEALLEAGAAAPSEVSASWRQAAYAMLGTALPWLVLIWIMGVLALSMRYLAGWTYTLHLRRRGTREVGQRWQEQRTRLAQQLGVTRPVRLVASALVHVPTVAGWLRPIILMPVSVFTGLTPRQVEMVIAHELAHIRRHDYLVNLMQAMCETLLFYHPAVWWVSQRIRIEREHCCDDLVVAVCGDAFTYAEALTKMEQVRQTTPRLALAVTGGSLLDRVRRLLEGPTEAAPGAARWLAGLALVAVLLLSLPLSSVLDGAWGKTYAWIAGDETEETLQAARNGDRLGQHPLLRRGYGDTALRLERLIFDAPSLSVQLEALDELRVLPKRSSLPSLVNIAERHPRQQVRNEAVQWLGRIGDAYVVYALEGIAFEDRSLSVQMEALDALRNLPGKLGLASLMKIARAHPRAAMRNEAVQWLGRIDGEAARLFLERILFEDTHSSVQMEAFDALKKLIDNPRIFFQIAETHPNEAIREQARERIAVLTMGTRLSRERLYAEFLSRAKAFASAQGQSSRALSSYQTTATLLEELIFKNESPSVNLEALDALKNLPAEVAMPSLRKIVEEHSHEQTRSEATRRLEAVEDVARANKVAEEAWSQAITDLEHPKANRRITAVETLKTSPSRTVSTILAGIAFEDRSLEVQMAALNGLPERGGLQAMAHIARIARKHPNPAMRAEAVRSIDDMQADDRLPLLEEIIFNDESFKVQDEAFKRLYNAPEAELVALSLQRIAEEHPSTLFRNLARQKQRLEAARETDDEADYSWSQALDDLRHPSASRRLKALDKVEEKKSIDLLTTLADMAYEDPSLEVQLEILDIFRDRGDWDGDSWVVHIAQNHPNARMRNEAVQSLQSQDAETIQPVLERIIFDDASLEVQQEALDLLNDLPDDFSVPVLIKVLQNHPVEEMRQEAFEELEDRDDPRARQAVQRNQ